MSHETSMPLLEFFKRCRRPLYYKSMVNKLKVHALLSLGAVRQSLGKNQFVYGQAYIVKEPKGWYRFVGLWTLPTKPTRPDVWVEVRFQIHKSQIVFEESVTLAHLNVFFKVCRYLGVHKRVEIARYQAALQRSHEYVDLNNTYWEEAMKLEFEYGLDDVSHEYLHHRACGSWFLAERIPPLFCGVVLDGLRIDKRYKSISPDIRDRIAAMPLVVMNHKQDIREGVK